MANNKRPSNPEIAYLDLDALLFAAAASGEQVWHKVMLDGNEVGRFKSAAEYSNWLEDCEFIGSDLEFGLSQEDIDKVYKEVDYEILDVERCYKTFDSELKRWVKEAGVTKYKGYVSSASGKPTFRTKVATIFPYKGNRKSTRKPHHLEAVRKYALRDPNIKKAVSSVEVDDYVVLMSERVGEKAVCVGVDKDSRQCSGTWIHIINGTDEPFYSSPNIVGVLERKDNKVTGHGHLHLLWQMLAGDKSVDNIGGVKGIGVAKAYDTLKDFSGQSIDKLEEAVHAVCRVYESTYGDNFRYTHAHTQSIVEASWQDIMWENLRLLWMLRSKDDTGSFIGKYIDSYRSDDGY